MHIFQSSKQSTHTDTLTPSHFIYSFDSYTLFRFCNRLHSILLLTHAQAIHILNEAYGTFMCLNVCICESVISFIFFSFFFFFSLWKIQCHRTFFFYNCVMILLFSFFFFYLYISNTFMHVICWFAYFSSENGYLDT